MGRGRRGAAPEIWHWRIETANFTFDVVATSEAEARDLMQRAWARHKRLTGASWGWADVSEGRPVRRVLGAVLRDGEVFYG